MCSAATSGFVGMDVDGSASTTDSSSGSNTAAVPDFLNTRSTGFGFDTNNAGIL
jgi:hypothetical protein